MKKLYVTPKIQSINLCSHSMLAASCKDGGIGCMCFCPHIPETECELFYELLKRKFGKNKETLEKIGKGIIKTSCPNKDVCEDYLLFRKITNERQR